MTGLATADPAVLAAARRAHEETLAYVRSPVGASPRRSIPSSRSSPTILRCRSSTPRRPGTSEAARADPAGAGGYADSSAAAPFKSGGRGGPDYYTDVEAGPIAIKNVADLYLYPNALRAVKIDGATLGEWLERSAGLFRRIDPNSHLEQPLLDANFASYNFDVIDGVNYEIDVTQPSRYDSDGKLVAPDARRIRNLTFRGAPIDPTEVFIVVTNNYRASGGGNFPGCDGSTIVLEAPIPIATSWCAISSRPAISSPNPTAIGALRPGPPTWSRRSSPRPPPRARRRRPASR